MICMGWDLDRSKGDEFGGANSKSPRPHGLVPHMILIALWTIGMGALANQTTGMSPIWISCATFEIIMISLRLNAGAIESDITTCTGQGELVSIDNPFHNMKSVLIMSVVSFASWS